MFDFIKTRAHSFRNAFAGLGFVMRTQKNAWIHLCVTTIVIIAAYILQISTLEWALILLAIGMVWMAELFNTAMEALVDLVSPDDHHLAKVCKDVGAAAVLVAAISSIFVGIFILGSQLLIRIKSLFL